MLLLRNAVNVRLTPAQLIYLRECVYSDLECGNEDDLEIACDCLRRLDEAQTIFFP